MTKINDVAISETAILSKGQKQTTSSKLWLAFRCFVDCENLLKIMKILAKVVFFCVCVRGFCWKIVQKKQDSENESVHRCFSNQKKKKLKINFPPKKNIDLAKEREQKDNLKFFCLLGNKVKRWICCYKHGCPQPRLWAPRLWHPVFELKDGVFFSKEKKKLKDGFLVIFQILYFFAKKYLCWVVISLVNIRTPKIRVHKRYKVFYLKDSIF